MIYLEKTTIELVEEIFEILWQHKFTEDRKLVQNELQGTIESYLKAK